LFHQIKSDITDSSKEITEVKEIIDFLIKERIDWLQAFLIRFPYDYLFEGHDPERIEIVVPGIQFLIDHIDKSSDMYESLNNNFKKIKRYVSTHNEIIDASPKWDCQPEDFTFQ
jgi:hypothetical protein